MFRSDFPITIVLMISLVAWDVTRGGWLGPTMVLWCYWQLGGKAHLVSCVLWWTIVWMYHVWWMVSFILLYFVSWIWGGWCISISTYVYSFKPFIPCDMYSGWLSIPNLIFQEAFGTKVYYLKDIGLFIILSCGCGSC